ncbi:MAG: GTP-binding protein [Promethearchaeota archaeon]|nr:MAG: GTP-binding protein [Candidatus Lokiarchaeota archaeon]
MKDTKEKYVFKITIVGDGFVGKTSLIRKFTQGTFQKDYIKTIGAQFSIFEEKIDGDLCKLFFWDIAGQDEFHFLRPAFYKDSKAAIIVYTLEENNLGKESFKHLPNWHDDLKQFCGDIPIVVFANKVDLVDKELLNYTKISKIVKKRNLLGYYLTSAKTGDGVTQAFQALIRELYNKYKAIFSELQSSKK